MGERGRERERKGEREMKEEERQEGREKVHIKEKGGKQKREKINKHCDHRLQRLL